MPNREYSLCFEAMDYFICNSSGNYLHIMPDSRWKFETDRISATRFTEIKAKNFLNNSIPLSIRSECFVVPEVPVATTDFGNDREFDWDNISKSQRELYSSLLWYKEHLTSQHRRVEQEICDIQHYIEFESLNAAKGYRAYKMLHDKFRHRRLIKKELSKVSYILDATPQTFACGDVERKLYNVDHAEYTPRVLNELFGN